MDATVTSYIPDQRYGFAYADDGHDYYLHAEQLRDAGEQSMLYEGARIQFEPAAGPKGRYASDIVVKDGFILEESLDLEVWIPHEVVAWMIDSGLHSSADKARSRTIAYARKLGANALFDVEMSTGVYSSHLSGGGGGYSAVRDSAGMVPVTPGQSNPGAGARWYRCRGRPVLCLRQGQPAQADQSLNAQASEMYDQIVDQRMSEFGLLFLLTVILILLVGVAFAIVSHLQLSRHDAFFVNFVPFAAAGLWVYAYNTMDKTPLWIKPRALTEGGRGDTP